MKTFLRDHAHMELGQPGATPENLGPCPCDGCRHRTHCGDSGDACDAFVAYANRGKEPAWRYLPRLPNARIGQQLDGFRQRPASRRFTSLR